MTESEWLWSLIALIGVAVAFVALLSARHHAKVRRRQELEQKFGPEYQHTVEQLGRPSLADRELSKRSRRVRHLAFHDLDPQARAQFAAAWERIQARFIDDPGVAVTSANELINQVMRARGYPAEHFEQRVADLSVGHPNVVQHYRAAHELSRSVHNGSVDTEELRQAVIHYRVIFADLLKEGLSRPAVQQQYAQARGQFRYS